MFQRKKYHMKSEVIGMPESVFISYSSKDFDVVNTIKATLEKNAVDCWMAPFSIPAGSSYAQEIPNAIKSCKVFVLMLSTSSQMSKWVPKELSLALTYGKVVLPFMIEECELTEMFNFFLTDVQRYDVFAAQSENIKNLVMRIRHECGQTDSAAEQQTSIVIHPSASDEDSCHFTMDNWLSVTDPRVIERELAKALLAIRQQYTRCPNAQRFHEWYAKQLVDRFLLSEILERLSEIGMLVYHAAEIFLQIALINIHSADRKYIQQARTYLDRAIAIYSDSRHYDENYFKKTVYARWLLAVTYKQERNFGIASDICNQLVDYINDENSVFGCAYSETLLLPHRELAVINKEEILCDYLVSQTTVIQDNVKELFFTQRRLLEFYILNNEFDRARNLLPELLSSYEKCKMHIDAIYQTALYQNLFEYNMYVGEKEKADEYFRLAMESAKQNFWEGKQKKLKLLKSIYQ